MKKMGRCITTLFSGFLGLFTGLIGCSDDNDTQGGSGGTTGVTGAYMGMPPSFSGKVLNSSGNTPISNIRVELLRDTISLNTNRTDGAGNFQFWLTDDYYGKNYTLKITDTDGGGNGGDFKGQTNTYLLYNYTTSTNVQLEEK